MAVRVQGNKLPSTNDWLYCVHIDGEFEAYDRFVSSTRLTAEEMADVEKLYEEALDGYHPPMVYLEQMELLRRKK